MRDVTLSSPCPRSRTSDKTHKSLFYHHLRQLRERSAPHFISTSIQDRAICVLQRFAKLASSPWQQSRVTVVFLQTNSSWLTETIDWKQIRTKFSDLTLNTTCTTIVQSPSIRNLCVLFDPVISPLKNITGIIIRLHISTLLLLAYYPELQEHLVILALFLQCYGGANDGSNFKVLVMHLIKSRAHIVYCCFYFKYSVFNVLYPVYVTSIHCDTFS